MANALIIHSTPTQVRVALMQEHEPVEIYVEAQTERGVVGNIYRGRVVRVLPGMQAAFVDIGLARTAFLYVDDASAAPPSSSGSPDAPAPLEPGPALGPSAGRVSGPRGFRKAPSARIEDVVTAGQEIIVQVQKEPMGAKGARVSCQVSLPGRYAVFMPFAPHLGVSHRIASAADRQRLKDLLAPLAPEGAGFVARTAALSADAAALIREAKSLVATWNGVCSRARLKGGPQLLYAELDLVMRAARELVDADVSRIVVDDAQDCARLRDFVATSTQAGATEVHMFTGHDGIFTHFGIEPSIDAALKRRVNLGSGGYLVFDQAEALTVIDVNSGRFVGKHNLEQTMTALNLEAAAKIAQQLRLRNIGGIIIIDFIDMAQAENRNTVMEALSRCLQADKAKTTLVSISEIGLVEMTRKRVRESLGHVLQEPCFYCQGQGVIKRPATVAYEALRAAAQMLHQSHPKQLTVRCAPEVASHLADCNKDALARLEQDFGCRIVCAGQPNLHREQFELSPSAGAAGLQKAP